MSERVLSTQQAKDACTQFKTIVNGDLEGQIIALDKQCQILSDQNVWDGPHAINFRGNIWPDAKRSLDEARRQLDEMQMSLEAISREIFSAGGAPA